MEIGRSLQDIAEQTRTVGDQQEFVGLPGENADCGRFASQLHEENYQARSIDPSTHQVQPADPGRAFNVNPAHIRGGNEIAQLPIPPNADAVVYGNPGLRRFHMAKIDGDKLHQTDVLHRADLGGTYRVFTPATDGRASLEHLHAQRGVQPSQELANVAEFVRYCEQHYGAAGSQYFFGSLGPRSR